MSSVKILITGCFGLYGFELCNLLKKHYDIIGTYHQTFNECDFKTINVDITNFNLVKQIIYNEKPNIIIHTAAISNPVKADAGIPKIAYKTNVLATEELAKYANEINSRLIYISTDLVYAGYRGSFLIESSKLIPVSLYAETKLMAEEKVKEFSNNFTILRNSLMFGLYNNINNNFFNIMYHNLKSSKQVTLFNDQFRTPLSFNEASNLFLKLIELIKQDDKILKNQIANFGGQERVSRTDLGYLLCDLLNFDKNLIKPISINDLPNLPIVKDVSMNIDKITKFGIKPKSVKEMLEIEIEKIK
ncbi:MAG TPA: SDR family oxidoreductase [Melioribacteraceae bacterium]|nr:SDR family oxidoreductase [Melioribacteraceae bacterium]